MQTFRAQISLLIFASTILMCIHIGCKKDNMLPENAANKISTNKSGPISIEEAQQWFESAQDRSGLSNLTLPQKMNPMWFLARNSKFMDTTDIIIVPIGVKDTLLDIGANNDAKLIIFKNNDGETDGCILLLHYDTNIPSTAAAFSGYISTFSLSGQPLSAVKVDDGTIVTGVTDLDPIVAYTLAPDCGLYTGGCPPWLDWLCELLGLSHVHCPSAAGGGSGSGGYGGGLFGGHWGGGSGGSGSTGGGNGSNPYGGGVIFVGNGGTTIIIGNTNSDGTTGGGGGSNPLAPFFENEIFGTQSMFNHPLGFPCRNQNLNNPQGDGVFASFLLKATDNGLANFASQWLALTASGQYNAPAQALAHINWAEVQASNTNDYIDGTLAHNALLQAAVQMLNQTEAGGCEFTVDEAWESLSTESSQIECLLDVAHQVGGIPANQFNWLMTNLEMGCSINAFLGEHGNAQLFVSDIINQMVTYDLTFLEVDDLNFLFENPTIYTSYSQFLDQNPNQPLEVKTGVLRLVFLTPKKPITNLGNRLNCFDIVSNANFTHSVTLCVDQPVAGSAFPFSKGDLAGHTFLTIEQNQGGSIPPTRLSVGFYPGDFSSPCHQIDGGAWGDEADHLYDISVTFPLTAWGFNQLIQDMKTNSVPPIYDLSEYNCVNFALEKLDHLGINVPANVVHSIVTDPLIPTCDINGLAPSRLGQDLRNNFQLPQGATLNPVGGIAAPSTCQ